MVVDASGYLRTIGTVSERLAERSATLLLAARHGLDGRAAVPRDLLNHERVRTCSLPFARHDPAVGLFRATASALWSFSPGLDAASWSRQRAVRRLRKAARAYLETGPADLPDGLEGLLDAIPSVSAAFAERPPLLAALRGAMREVERLVPPPPALVQALADLAPDVVLMLSRCSLGGVEPDVIKACRALGIPSALLVWSWDNLTSKAVLDEHPDRLLVWNEAQVEEAHHLHGVDRRAIAVTGAPTFDPFFDDVAKRGNHPGSGVLYLGSSASVAPDEPAIFERWLAAIRSSSDSLLRDVEVTVRPHPGKEQRWTDAGVARLGVRLALPGPDAPLVDTLLAARVVVALNTSAELEAAVANRPVLTWMAGEDAPGQAHSAHFEYLLDRSGGFVVSASSLDEHRLQLEAALHGADDPDRRRRFVERFLRPRGLELPASECVVDEVLALAGRRSRAPR